MPQNRSAFVDSANAPLRIADSDTPVPGPNDIVVKNFAVAVNSNDPGQQAGFMVKSWPVVVGHDLAGEVYAVGEKVENLKAGDRIIGHSWQFLTGNVSDGAFSLYPRIPANNAAKIPDSLNFKDGVVLPLAIDTASAGFYGEGSMGLDFPSVDTEPSSKSEVVLVYGGSSSVGAAAIQLAANAGYRVFAVSSEKNFDLCRELGASEVFDRASSIVADDIAKAVGEDKFKGCYNAIGTPDTFEIVTPILEKIAQKTSATVFLANTKPPGQLPAFIKAKFALGVTKESFPVWENFVGQALAQGKFKALPKPRVVGKGLECLEKAFEARNGSVNAEKIVVEL